MTEKEPTKLQKRALRRLANDSKLSIRVRREDGKTDAVYSDGTKVEGGPSVVIGLSRRGLLRYAERNGKPLHRKKDRAPELRELNRPMILSVRGKEVA